MRSNNNDSSMAFLQGIFVGALVMVLVSGLAVAAAYEQGRRVGKLEHMAASACMTDYECEVIVGDGQ